MARSICMISAYCHLILASFLVFADHELMAIGFALSAIGLAVLSIGDKEDAK